MKAIWTLGEAICEIMRVDVDKGLEIPDLFRGPYPSGASSIFIDTTAKLGYEGGLIGAIGEDAFGACFRKKLEKDGVNCSFLSVNKELATGTSFVSYKKNGDRNFLFHIGNSAATQIIYPEEMPDNVGVFHVMGCAMMVSENFEIMMKKMAYYYYEKGAIISFDPNIRVESLKDKNLEKMISPIMEICSIFMPSLDELFLITQEKSVDAAVDKLFQNPVLKIIALKNGEYGCKIITREERIDVPICRVDVKDATGAGDSFDAGFLVSYLEGKPLLESAQVASATAAINCAAFGPMEGEISKEAVQVMINKNYNMI